jgi:hypothetical protein
MYRRSIVMNINAGTQKMMSIGELLGWVALSKGPSPGERNYQERSRYRGPGRRKVFGMAMREHPRPRFKYESSVVHGCVTTSNAFQVDIRETVLAIWLPHLYLTR